MKTMPYLLHALSPLHAGTGQSVDIIDLPIARMRSTGIPFVPGSSIKGVLRDARMDSSSSNPSANGKHGAVFGPSTEKASEYAGALIVGDARLLALPIRSMLGVFVWATSPLLLQLAKRDFAHLAPDNIPNISTRIAYLPQREQNNPQANQSNLVLNNKIYLEDLDLGVRYDQAVNPWAEFLAAYITPKHRNMFIERFVILDDETMSFLWETATQVDTRIRLNPQTRTVEKGALWNEESLPPESILIGLLEAYPSKDLNNKMDEQAVLKFALPKEESLQFGGKASVGRGRCRIIPVSAQSTTQN